MKLMLKLGGSVLACTLAASAAFAQAGPPTPEQQAQRSVDLRQALFELQGWNMGPLGGMLRGNVPFDAAVVQTNANNIAHLAPMIPDLFEADTSAFDVETEALDRIWSSKADFDMKAQALVDAAMAAAETAAGGDEGQTKAAIGRMGQACGSCHDDFRQD